MLQIAGAVARPVIVRAAPIILRGAPTLLARLAPRLSQIFQFGLRTTMFVSAALGFDQLVEVISEWASKLGDDVSNELAVSRRRVSNPLLATTYQHLLGDIQHMMNLDDAQFAKFILGVRFIVNASPGLLEARDGNHYFSAAEAADALVLMGISDQSGEKSNIGGDDAPSRNENPRIAPTHPVGPNTRTEKVPGETGESELNPLRDNIGGDDVRITPRPTVDEGRVNPITPRPSVVDNTPQDGTNPVFVTQGTQRWVSDLGVNWNRFYRSLVVLAGNDPQDVHASLEAARVMGALNGDPTGRNAGYAENDVARQRFIGVIPEKVNGKSITLAQFNAAYVAVVKSDTARYGQDDFGMNSRKQLRQLVEGGSNR